MTLLELWARHLVRAATGDSESTERVRLAWGHFMVDEWQDRYRWPLAPAVFAALDDACHAAVYHSGPDGLASVRGKLEVMDALMLGFRAGIAA